MTETIEARERETDEGTVENLAGERVERRIRHNVSLFIIDSTTMYESTSVLNHILPFRISAALNLCILLLVFLNSIIILFIYLVFEFTYLTI